MNYSVIQKEYLAIVWYSMGLFQHVPQGTAFHSAEQSSATRLA